MGSLSHDQLQAKKLIVLTPVRNEEWRIRGFLESTLVWADHVILSDQNSEDKTLEIAQSFDRVTVMRNDSSEFNELENRNNLLDECRRLFGKAIVFSLDADEALSDNIFSVELREYLQSLPEGTGLRVPHANLKQGGFWRVPLDPVAFVDDGRPTSVLSPIHFPRTCFSDFPMGSVELPLLLFHLQYLNESRYRSKVDWYQLLEVTKMGRTDMIGIYRQYHHFDAVSPKRLEKLNPQLTEEYRKRGLDPFATDYTPEPWWESESLRMFGELSRQEREMLILSGPAFHGIKHEGVESFIRPYLIWSQKWYRPSRVNPIFIAIYLVDATLKSILGAASRLGRTRA